MALEVEFKGKDIHSDEVVHGYLVNSNGKSYIIDEVEASNDYGEGTDLYAIGWWEVDPSSVVQTKK